MSLLESDSCFESVCRDLVLNVDSFPYELKRVGTIADNGRVIYNVLNPKGKPVSLAASDKIAIFKPASKTRHILPSNTSDFADYPFPGYKFTVVNTAAIKSMIKLAFDNGFPIRSAFHESTELANFCNEIISGLQESD